MGRRNGPGKITHKFGIFRLFAGAALSIFLIESLIMLVLNRFSGRGLHEPVHVLVDSLLISLAVVPVFYVFFYRPLMRSAGQRDEALKKLMDNRQRPALALEGTDEGVWDWNVATGEVFFNDRWAEVLGYLPGEVEGRVETWRKLVHPDDMDQVMAVLGDHLAGKTPFYESEHRMLRKDGGWAWILDRGKVVERGEGGEPLRMTGTHREITSRKLLEEAVNRSEQRLAALFQRSNDGIVICAMDGTIREVNDTLLRMLGYARGEMVGRPVGMLYLPSEEDRAERAWMELRQNGSSEFEITFADRRGQELVADVSANVIELEGEAIVQAMIRDVTERRRIERELDTLFNMTLDMVCIASMDGRLLRLNRSWSRVLGYDLAELEGSAFMDYVHPDDREATLEAMSGLSRGEPVHLFENRYLARDGGVKWLSWVSMPVLEEGTVYAIARDVTERKKGERALRESQDILRQFVEHTPAAVAMFDTEVRYIEVSRRWLTDYRLKEEDIIGKSHYDVFPETPERWKDIHAECLKGAVKKADEDAFERLDGSIDWLRWEVRPWRKAGGEVGGIIMFTEVITEEVLSRRALRESEARLRGILDAAVDGVVTINESGRIESFNPAAERIFGWKSHEVVSRDVEMLMPERYRARHHEYFQRRVENKTKISGIIGVTREVEGLRKDGVEIPMDLSLSQVVMGDKTIFAGIIRDITDRKRIERMQKEFISTVNHELRTPLTSIHGSLGLLAGGAAGELGEGPASLVGIALQNSKRLIHLIGDILDMEKIAAGKLEFRMQKVDLMSLVRESMAANEPYARELETSYRLAKSVPATMVWADPDRLVQVLANLLSNAAKFTSPGTTVEVETAKVGDFARVLVTDHGPGIPEEFRKRIFEKFSQADSSDARTRQQGTGLGLAIAKAIVDKHGGSIAFISRQGEGTTFYFDLPLYREEIHEREDA